MYNIQNLVTGELLINAEGTVYEFSFKDNADEVAQDLSHAEDPANVIYTAVIA